MLFYYPIAEGDEGEACDEAEEDVGDESADIAILEHLQAFVGKGGECGEASAKACGEQEKEGI